MQFKSDLKLLFNGPDCEPQDHSKFPQLYRADLNFALSQTDSLLFKGIVGLMLAQSLGRNYKYTSIDSRTHMLMKGMYPCIPGWHCDDFYRPPATDGDGEADPALDRVEAEAPQEHYMVVYGGNSLTEFLRDDILLAAPSELERDDGIPAYQVYDEIIEKAAPPTVFIEPGKIYSFGPTCFHRCVPATENGFRTFIRMTRSNHRYPKNQTRYQSNVYIQGRIAW